MESEIEQTLREAHELNLSQQSTHQASQDLLDWKTLETSEAFHRCFLRRVKEKRDDIAKKVVEGVNPDQYVWMRPQIALLDEILKMPKVEKGLCFKLLNPRAGLD